MFVHEDARRTLLEFGRGTFRVAKAVVAKEKCSVGNHHHLHKDELFLLATGKASYVRVGNQEWSGIEAPFEFPVPRGTFHRFDLEPGSVLLGVATNEYDPADEVRGEP